MRLSFAISMKKLSMALLVLSCSVLAQMPHVFTAGETAKAADVNDNFNCLMARIDSLKQSTALHDSIVALRAKIAADSALLAAADSSTILSKGTVAAFLTAPGNDGFLPGSNSSWIFAAGQGEVNGVTIPDLRGRFLRGIDYIVTGRAATNLDPDGERSPGSKQVDAFQGHTHLTPLQDAVSNGSAGGYAVAFDRRGGWGTPYPNSTPQADSANGTPRTASETRPVNSAVYWYVKVK
ncbi:MAG TPA: hypothetical protein DCO75_10815 [Fibrobacteres bacterium]|nr:hypothetical protein [Fibrobacterota bacterium]